MFKDLFDDQVRQYDEIHGLSLDKQSIDCGHRKSPLSKDKSGNSPVDRRKMGTKISVIAQKHGVILGLAIGGSNQPDHELF